MEKKNRKIVIMGGTFDPIHIGHLILGEAAYEQFGLDEVWFLPAGNPPHKRNRAGQAKDAQRVEMVRRAIASNPHFVLCIFQPSGEDLTDATNTLTDLFRKVLDKKDLTVKVENLKDENVSSMVTLSEESRRMQDMMKMYGMTGMDPSMFGGQETLILNAKHPLVQYILKNGENDNTSLFCEQLYDLAMISHKPLSPDEMTKFVSRSNQIMMLLAK